METTLKLNRRIPLFFTGLLFLLLFFSIGLFTGCLPKEKKVVIKIAIGEVSQREFLAPLTDLYSYKHPNVSFDIKTMGYMGLYKALIEDATTGNFRFDVVFIDDPWVVALYKLNYLRDLSEEFSWKPDKDLLDIFTRSAQVNGRYYAVPVIGNVQIFAVRTDLTSEYCYNLPNSLPSTWDDVLSCARKVYHPNEDIFGYIQRTFYREGEGNYNPLVTDWLPIYYSYGGSFEVDEEGYITRVDGEALLNSLKLLKALMETSFQGLEFLEHNDYERVISLIGGKKFGVQVSMGLIWPMGWAYKLYSPMYSKNPNSIAFTPLPKGPSGRAPILGVWHLGIPVTSEHPGEAFKFISWLASSQVQMYYGAYGGVPTRRSALDNPALIMTYPYYGVVMESLTWVRSRPRTPYWVNYERAFGKVMKSYLKGEIGDSELMEKFNEAIEEVRKLSNP